MICTKLGLIYNLVRRSFFHCERYEIIRFWLVKFMVYISLNEHLNQIAMKKNIFYYLAKYRLTKPYFLSAGTHFHNKMIKLSMFLYQTVSFFGISNLRMHEKHILFKYLISKEVKLQELSIVSLNIKAICTNEGIQNGRSYDNTNVQISECFFRRLNHFNDNGGVIYINSQGKSIEISKSMFYNCRSNNGGAIWFYSTNSVLRMVCAEKCSAIYSHFAYLRSSQGSSNTFLSISACAHITSQYESLSMNSGYQFVNDTNSSMNKAEIVSCLCIQSALTFYSCRCSFSNNIVSENTCLSLLSTSGSFIFANIINNNSPSMLGVIHIANNGLIYMSNCIFDENQNVLFSIWEGSLYISHSYINHIGTFSSSISVTLFENNTYTKIQTHIFDFMGSKFCKTPDSTSNVTSTDISYMQYLIIGLAIISILFSSLWVLNAIQLKEASSAKKNHLWESNV